MSKYLHLISYNYLKNIVKNLQFKYKYVKKNIFWMILQSLPSKFERVK